jgi:hypothetical protein
MQSRIMFKGISRIYLRLKNMFQLLKYNEFNIEEYFRTKGAQIGTGNRIYISSLGDSPFLI